MNEPDYDRIAVQALGGVAPPANTTPLPLLLFNEIEPVLSAIDFVQGVLVEGGAAMVYGDSNAGKTFWVTDLSLHIAAAMKWNGRRVAGGGVVYCVLEGGNGFRNRVAAWSKLHKPSVNMPFAAIPSSINLLDPAGDVARLIDAIKAAEKALGCPVKLVVIDTLSRAMAGGNENAPDDMGALVRSMDRIRQATAACLLFVHHSGKDAAKGARGHSLLRAAIDTEIEVRVDEATGNRTATVLKQRDLAKGASFGFRLDVVTLGENQHGEPVTTCKVVADQAATSSRATLSEGDKGWMRDLANMFAGADTRKISPQLGMEPTLTLTREQVRKGFRDQGRFDLSDAHATLTDAQRRQMSTALNRLKYRGKIGMTVDLVWLVQPREGDVSAP